MPENSSRYFANRSCCEFPCHIGADPENFNCLFCFCPLYSLIDCGGRYSVNSAGVKDCSKCLYPHKAENYDAILAKLGKLIKKRKFPEDGERI